MVSCWIKNCTITEFIADHLFVNASPKEIGILVKQFKENMPNLPEPKRDTFFFENGCLIEDGFIGYEDVSILVNNDVTLVSENDLIKVDYQHYSQDQFLKFLTKETSFSPKRYIGTPWESIPEMKEEDEKIALFWKNRMHSFPTPHFDSLIRGQQVRALCDSNTHNLEVERTRVMTVEPAPECVTYIGKENSMNERDGMTFKEMNKIYMETKSE